MLEVKQFRNRRRVALGGCKNRRSPMPVLDPGLLAEVGDRVTVAVAEPGGVGGLLGWWVAGLLGWWVGGLVG